MKHYIFFQIQAIREPCDLWDALQFCIFDGVEGSKVQGFKKFKEFKEFKEFKKLKELKELKG
jgi:hypothetical protein